MLTDKQIDDMTAPDTTASEWLNEEREDAENLSNSLRDAFNEARSSATDAADLEAARPLRDELERRFQGRRASEIVEDFKRIDAAVRADPINAPFDVFHQYAKSRQTFGSGMEFDRPEKTEAAYGLREVALPGGGTYMAAEGSLGDAIANAMRESARDSNGEIDELRELQSELKQLYPQTRFSDALRQMLDFDEAAREDPFRAAARLAALHGCPLDDEQAQQYEAGQFKAAEVGHLMTEDEFKPLAGRELDIVELINAGAMVPTGDTVTDLRTAKHVLAIHDEAQAMARDTKRYPGLKSLQGAMTKLLNSGAAKDLRDAYAQAAAKAAKAPKPTIRTELRENAWQQRKKRAAATADAFQAAHPGLDAKTRTRLVDLINRGEAETWEDALAIVRQKPPSKNSIRGSITAAMKS